MPYRFATWALVLAAGVLVVQMLGVDVRPLLLVTGWSSVLAGLASQQLLANAVSGVQMVGEGYGTVYGAGGRRRAFRVAVRLPYGSF